MISHMHQDELGGAESCRKGGCSSVLRAPHEGQAQSPGLQQDGGSVHVLGWGPGSSHR